MEHGFTSIIHKRAQELVDNDVQPSVYSMKTQIIEEDTLDEVSEEMYDALKEWFWSEIRPHISVDIREQCYTDQWFDKFYSDEIFPHLNVSADYDVELTYTYNNSERNNN